ncbi:MAG: glutathione synthase [Casimicrobiaceae bacterium]|nr:glutathione synthase [Casimicrobiaceae bacterium]MCX8097504.1 glutathione synthase [Casimicrobiaceae bacterium]MDW8311223.1 glutathione synthase [Burkholderiales bacterium]
MKIAFHLDWLASLKAYKDSSVAIMGAAQAAGHELYAIEPGGVFFDPQQGVCGEACAIELTTADRHGPGWFRAQARVRWRLRDFDVVLERKDPPFDLEYVYHTYLFERAEQEGARVWNAPRAIRDHNEKLALLRHLDLAPPTLVTRSAQRLREFVASERDVIFKPLDGMGGNGIFRVREGDPNLSVIIETLTDQGRRSIMAQRYLPEIAEGDKRILLIAGEVVPYALARIPLPGETRGNMAAGGRPEARPLSASDRRIAETLAARLWREGLFLVGLDVIGERVTEINVTSPTGFVELREQTGFDAAALFVRKLEQTSGKK